MTEYEQRQYNRGYLNGYEQAMGFDHSQVDNETEDAAYLSGTRDGRKAAIVSWPFGAPSRSTPPPGNTVTNT